MNSEMQNVITGVIATHGADVLTNAQRVNAMLLDLAPGMPRERILVRNFAEADGFRLLQSAGETLPLAVNRLIQTLTDLYSLERDAAAWVTYTCASALGYDLGYEVNTAESFLIAPPKGETTLVAMGMAHMVAAAADGTVFSHGMNDYFQCDVGGWRQVVSVAAGVSHTVGLKADGTVLAAGNNSHDECDVAGWEEISALYAFGHETVGVRADGTVLSAGRGNMNLEHFKNIKTIAKAPLGVYGINEEGNVFFSDTDADEDTLSELAWLNTLPAVAAIISHARECIALCRNGNIYKYGESPGYFSVWRGVVSLVDLGDAFAALRDDGTVRVVPFNREKPRTAPTAADKWKNIVSIHGNYQRLVGITKDGRLTACYTGTTVTKSFGNFEFLQEWYPII